MKRHVFAALLAGAMVLSLAACGGSGNAGGSASSNPGSGSDVSAIAPGGSSSQPDASAPDGSQPDASVSNGGSASGGASGGSAGGSASSAEGLQPDSKVTLTLNKTDVTLKKAGSTFRLRYTAQPDTDGVPSFTSDKPEIATVDESGNVTAVAPGQATITVEYDGVRASCVVRCRWDEQTSGSGSGSSSGSSGSSSSGSSASKVDLSSFYSTITGKYQFSFMTEADDATLTNFFAGLSDLSLSQRVVYLCGMSPAPVGDFALVQVSDSKDVDTVKSIFQARIDYMVGDGNGPGGAFYPMEQTTWEEYSRIAVNGDYVMLIVHESCDDIAKEFNALF